MTLRLLGTSRHRLISIISTQLRCYISPCSRFLWATTTIPFLAFYFSFFLVFSPSTVRFLHFPPLLVTYLSRKKKILLLSLDSATFNFIPLTTRLSRHSAICSATNYHSGLPAPVFVSYTLPFLPSRSVTAFTNPSHSSHPHHLPISSRKQLQPILMNKALYTAVTPSTQSRLPPNPRVQSFKSSLFSSTYTKLPTLLHISVTVLQHPSVKLKKHFSVFNQNPYHASPPHYLLIFSRHTIWTYVNEQKMVYNAGTPTTHSRFSPDPRIQSTICSPFSSTHTRLLTEVVRSKFSFRPSSMYLFKQLSGLYQSLSIKSSEPSLILLHQPNVTSCSSHDFIHCRDNLTTTRIYRSMICSNSFVLHEPPQLSRIFQFYSCRHLLALKLRLLESVGWQAEFVGKAGSYADFSIVETVRIKYSDKTHGDCQTVVEIRSHEDTLKWLHSCAKVSSKAQVLTWSWNPLHRFYSFFTFSNMNNGPRKQGISNPCSESAKFPVSNRSPHRWWTLEC